MFDTSFLGGRGGGLLSVISILGLWGGGGVYMGMEKLGWIEFARTRKRKRGGEGKEDWGV